MSSTAATNTDAPARPRISLTMIVKNEADNLRLCLDSVIDLVQEIIIVDLGSEDQTKQVALQYGAKVLDFAWTDSFAAARNETLKHATGEWVFCLEANQRLDEVNREKFRALVANLPAEGNVAYSMKCVYFQDQKAKAATVSDAVCLFRNHPGLEWRYRLYAQILPSLRLLGTLDIVFSEISILENPAASEMRSRNLQRNLHLLNLEFQEQPNDPFTLINLGQIHFYELGQPDVALSYWQRSLQLSHPRDSIVRKLYFLIATAQRSLRQYDAALATCQAGLVHFPNDVELNLKAGLEYLEVAEFKEAERCLLRVFESKECGHFGSVDALLISKARHNLACHYQKELRVDEAETQWKAALEAQPGFVEAFERLGQLLLKQKRWNDLRQLLSRMAPYPEAQPKIEILAGRLAHSLKDFARARKYFEQAIARSPEDVIPRGYLCNALLAEGKDWDAAERAVREVLRLVPGDPTALKNLEFIRSKRLTA